MIGSSDFNFETPTTPRGEPAHMATTQSTTTRKNVVAQAELAQARVEGLVKDLQTEVSKRVGNGTPVV